MTIVFVLNLDESPEFHCSVLLCAALSAKAVHPQAQLVLILDREGFTSNAFGPWSESNVFDSIINASVPRAGQSVTFRNRWIKTQLPTFVEGPFLYLDNDTFVLRSLAPLFDKPAPFAAAVDCYDPRRRDPKRRWIDETFDHFGWTFPPAVYLNGGVICSDGGAEAEALFAEWHRRWLDCVEAGIEMDQPALNSLWEDGRWRPRLLGREWNAMVEVDERQIRGARILHLMTSYTALRPYVFDNMVHKAAAGGDVEADVRRVIRDRYIWKDRSHVARHLRCGNYAKALGWWLRKRLRHQT